MGAADIVPGVSGGTIAFISGIYEELISSLSQFRFSLFSNLKNKGFKTVWGAVNGNFLITLFILIDLSFEFALIVLLRIIELSGILYFFSHVTPHFVRGL